MQNVNGLQFVYKLTLDKFLFQNYNYVLKVCLGSIIYRVHYDILPI